MNCGIREADCNHRFASSESTLYTIRYRDCDGLARNGGIAAIVTYEATCTRERTNYVAQLTSTMIAPDVIIFREMPFADPYDLPVISVISNKRISINLISIGGNKVQRIFLSIICSPRTFLNFSLSDDC